MVSYGVSVLTDFIAIVAKQDLCYSWCFSIDVLLIGGHQISSCYAPVISNKLESWVSFSTQNYLVLRHDIGIQKNLSFKWNKLRKSNKLFSCHQKLVSTHSIPRLKSLLERKFPCEPVFVWLETLFTFYNKPEMLIDLLCQFLYFC